MRKQVAKVEQTGADEVTVTAIDSTQHKMAAHVHSARLLMIKHGLEWEFQFGGKLTAKAPSCYTIIREEYGIRSGDKHEKYLQFCKMHGFEPKKMTKFK